MLNEKLKINTMLSFTLIILMIGASIQFLLPIHLVNPYEYFYGKELKTFQVFHIFFGGALLPLLSLTVGYIATKVKSIMKPLILSGLVLLMISLILNGQDVLFLAAISGLFVLLFRNRPMLMTLVTLVVLVVAHVLLNVLLKALNAMQSNNIVYSAIQKFNDYVSVFRTSDIIEYANLNLGTIVDLPLLMLLIFISIPCALIGSLLARVKLEEILPKYMQVVLILVFLFGGLVIKLIEVLSVGSMSSTIIGEYIGGPMVAIGMFLSIWVLACYMPIGVQNRFNHFGQYAIVYYLVFSTIMGIIFYGIGFNLYGEVQVLNAVGIAMLVTLSTLLFSQFLTKS
ncbi:DUF418 domain-containing protein [Phocicoccus pinnipedialis]|uniref:DUF418 domain-containing protein n=1 Tax=Phocicoccus pinnipedialis TaxID=110845 RepID=A0A6V7R8X1_9BACL|nr:DUF418 domain-containing protein [Jeotgalicoccus pinnipedialis]MBP1938898.1 uncharacterized protein [Jeotgalicoccus pinnipedialis]CAD2073262.1 hypothetical protein JEOPIN946_00646 [Jeotgalicoccus pinnipedialis]